MHLFILLVQDEVATLVYKFITSMATLHELHVYITRKSVMVSLDDASIWWLTEHLLQLRNIMKHDCMSCYYQLISKLRTFEYIGALGKVHNKWNHTRGLWSTFNS